MNAERKITCTRAMPQIGRRIVVVGTAGSGKTTLACRLSRYLGIPHVELDELYWEPSWTPVPVDLFRERVAEALRTEAWVVDGNYSKARDVVWSRADTIVWLDYVLPVILARLLRRTVRRITRREELWSGNRETWRSQLSRDSIVWWVLSSYRRRRREYSDLFNRPEYAHLTVVHVRSPRAAMRWLGDLRTQPATPV